MVDALSDLLRAVRLSGGVFLDAEFSAPWCVSSRIGPEDCRAFGIATEQVIATHYVLDGELWLAVEGESPSKLGPGDLVLLARNDLHRLGSDLSHPPVSGDDLMQPAGDSGLATIRHGGGGARAHVICGFLASDLSANPLFASLPRVFTLRSSAVSRDFVASSFRYAANEFAAANPGTDMMLAKLSELLFIEAVRGCIAELPPEHTGWLAGLRDPHVGRALGLLHARVADPWTVDALARAVGLSRSALGERFAALLGEPPMRYLTRWRMRVAANMLRDGGQNTANVAYAVGFNSEAAFNRAFKREYGIPPAAWRRQSTPG